MPVQTMGEWYGVEQVTRTSGWVGYKCDNVRGCATERFAAFAFQLDHSSGKGVQFLGRLFLEFRCSADAAEKVMAGGVQGVLLAGVL